MAEISLRDYLDFVETRLERGAHQEVAAHCRHILETYPKHLETYRLLARALLEQEDYTGALDLFQRVLSADPNDFVAHIGMSDCYRETSATEQAIWHLERAFEQAPSNQDLQDEIKRLYATLSDRQMRKVPLTGGALARMYAKGDLYEQAVPELSKAITTDPERLDLQALLADVLWRSGERVKAGRVAGELLKRLPNSLEGNRILARLWLAAGKADEARPFLSRVRELDPYAAYEIEQQGRAAPVEAFMLTRLDYRPDRSELAGTAEWVAQIEGLEKKKGVTGPLKPPGGSITDVFAQPEQPAAPAQPPAWLQEALSAEAPAAPAQPAAVPDDLAALLGIPEAEPQRTTKPDWLRQALDEKTPARIDLPAIKEDPPTWLQETLTDPEDTLGVRQPAQDVLKSSATPDWLQEIGPAPSAVEGAAKQEDKPVAPDDNDIPDWLAEGDLDNSEDAAAWLMELAAKYDPNFQADQPTATPAAPAPAADDDDLPDWLKGDAPAAAAKPADDDLDWLRAPAESTPDANDDGIPDWLNEKIDQEAEAKSATAEDDSLDWLDSQVKAQGVSTEAPISEALKKDAPPMPGPPIPNLDEPAVPVDDDELPDWLRSAAVTEEKPAGLDIDLDAIDAGDDELDWLKAAPAAAAADLDGLDAIFGKEETLPPTQEMARAERSPALAAADDDDDLPDWLRGAASDEEDLPPTQVIPRAQPARPAASAVAADDDDDLPDWLRGDAEPEPARPMPVAAAAPALDDDDDLPDWLRATADEAEEKAVAPGPAAAQAKDLPIIQKDPELADSFTGAGAARASAADDDEGSIPDWLRVVASSPGQQQEDSGDDLPDWLRGVATEPAAAAPSAAADDDLPDWLSTVSEAPQPQPEPEPARPAPMMAAAPLEEEDDEDDLPAWLRGEAEPEPARAVPVMAAAPLEEEDDEDDLPAWLRGEAEAQPAPEPARPAPILVPDDEEEELPAWLRSIADDEEPEDEAPAATTVARPTPEPGLPEWLAVPVAPRGAPPSSINEEADEPDTLILKRPKLDAPPEVPPLRKATTGLTGWLEAVEAASPDAPPEAEEAAPAPTPISAPEPQAQPAAAALAPAASLIPKAVPGDYLGLLAQGRAQLASGELNPAVETFEGLVSSGQLLPEVVSELTDYLEGQRKDHPKLRRVAGDALMAQGRLQEALEMYIGALQKL